MPAARAKHRIIEPDADPRRHFASRGDSDQKIAAGKSVALGDCQRRRHDFRRDVSHGGAVHIAHRHRGNEVTIEQRRAGKRQLPAADHARLAALRQSRSERRDLPGLLALMAGYRASERIQEQILAMLADAFRQIAIAQRCGEFRQHLCRFLPSRHRHIDVLPRQSFRSVAVSGGRWQSAVYRAWHCGLVGCISDPLQAWSAGAPRPATGRPACGRAADNLTNYVPFRSNVAW